MALRLTREPSPLTYRNRDSGNLQQSLDPFLRLPSIAVTILIALASRAQQLHSLDYKLDQHVCHPGKLFGTSTMMNECSNRAPDEREGCIGVVLREMLADKRAKNGCGRCGE